MNLPAYQEYDEILQGIELGYLCPADGGDCEFEEILASYGEDRDGNRGIWIRYERCRKCGEER